MANALLVTYLNAIFSPPLKSVGNVSNKKTISIHQSSFCNSCLCFTSKDFRDWLNFVLYSMHLDANYVLL